MTELGRSAKIASSGAGAFGFLRAAITGIVSSAIVNDQAGELVECREFGCKLELKLSRVDALGLRHDEPPPRELYLELERLVRLAVAIALRGLLKLMRR